MYVNGRMKKEEAFPCETSVSRGPAIVIFLEEITKRQKET